MSENLERRIAAALASESVTPSEISELLDETDAAMIAAEEATEEQRAKALDPVLSPDPKAAREAMQAAEFARDRLRTMLPRLRNHLVCVQYAQAHARWRKEYDAIRAKRDAAAEELKVLYPRVVTELVELLTRVREIDAEIRRVNERKPHMQGERWDGLEWLLPTECKARGVDGFRSPAHSLDRGVVLPDFTQPGENAWPPHKPPFL
jgi:hypothetical protein